MDTLSFEPVQQLVQLLVGAGMSASTNPEDVTMPGAWVTVEGVRAITLTDIQLECAVYLVVGDQDYARAYTALADLYNQAATVLSPDGLVVPQGVVMPGNPTPLPALRVPVNLI
jgi:hypothetical protein